VAAAAAAAATVSVVQGSLLVSDTGLAGLCWLISVLACQHVLLVGIAVGSPSPSFTAGVL